MTRRLLLAFALIVASSPALAQQFPSQNVQLPTFVMPASAVNGGGVFSGQLLAPLTPTDCSLPPYSFAGDTNTGIGYVAADTVGLCGGGALASFFNGSGIGTNLLVLDAANADVRLSRFQANGLRLASGDSFNIEAGGLGVGVVNTTSGTIQASGPQITVGSGTGITVNNPGEFREVVYKVTIASTAFVCAAVTCDVTVTTLPAKTQITAVMADLTQTFACTATCTSSTLSMIFGRGSGGAQWLASFDADAAAAQFGDADAELGTTMTRAAAIQGGSFEAWASTQAAVLRLTSGTGNIGNGSATNLSQGSVTLYVVTRVMP